MAWSTKAGVWLMPAPESMIGLDLELDNADDLGWAVDVVAGMRRDGLLQQSPSIGSLAARRRRAHHAQGVVRQARRAAG